MAVGRCPRMDASPDLLLDNDDPFCACGDACAHVGPCAPLQISVIERNDFTANGPDTWLWCLYCNHFFQERHVRVDDLGHREGCAFCRCAGYGVALFPWRTFRTPGWPETELELRVGAMSVDGSLGDLRSSERHRGRAHVR